MPRVLVAVAAIVGAAFLTVLAVVLVLRGVAVVIDGQPNARSEILRAGERGVDRDGECLFGDPSAA